MKIYLPAPSQYKISTLGERWFFNNKFWKLYVMFGYHWTSLACVKTGFSFFNVCTKNGRIQQDKINQIIDFLDKNEIKYHTELSPRGWQYKIVISQRKAGLEKIDKAYKKFYNEHLKECHGMYRYYNDFIDEDERQSIIEYYTKQGEVPEMKLFK